MHTCIHKYVYTYIYKQLNIHAYAVTHTYTQVHMHTYKYIPN